MDTATNVGPLVSEEHAASVLRHISLALTEGAGLECGGDRPPGLDQGYFVAPTLLTGVRPDMRIAHDEVFGPVLSVLTFTDDDEALRIANSVGYGLTAAVWTRDLARAHRFAAGFEAGYVWVNSSSRHFPGVPYGGVKASGVGREECLDELLSFTQVKAVTIANANVSL
jgi:2-formylbenzoate dehydrogenase